MCPTGELIILTLLGRNDLRFAWDHSRCSKTVGSPIAEVVCVLLRLAYAMRELNLRGCLIVKHRNETDDGEHHARGCPT